MTNKFIYLLKCFFLFLVLGSGFFLYSPATAQNIIETDLASQPASILVQNLLGAGVSFSNVTYQGTGVSSGTFTGGNGIIGFDSGIILSNGAAASVKGPHGTGASTCLGIPGDQDLANLAGVSLATTHDATALSFDFVPQFNSISFQYVFSSDEYNNFIGSYDDVFGFFVNGTNAALIPGTSTVVSINTVNNCQNSSYFIDNSGGQFNAACTITKASANLNTTMNGLTTVLTVNAAVTPGVSNHIKLAICDLGDCNLDSNVFIRASSFNSGPTATPTEFISPTPTPTSVDNFYVDKNLFSPSKDKAVTIFVQYNQYPGEYDLRIYNSAGEHIKTLAGEKLTAPVSQYYQWDGTNKFGDPCASGVYIFYLVEPYSRKIKRVLLVR